MNQTLYVAYGSNLNMDQMSVRCPNARPLYPVVIKDWKLVFRGVADITPAEGHEVMAGLWAITEECEKALDRYEGFPNLYRKHYFDFEGEDSVMTYVMNRDGIRPPMEHYYAVIEEGYQDFSLETLTLERAWRTSFAESDGGGHVPARYRA